MDTLEIIQDRTFDAECAKRIGLIELHDEILRKIKSAHPKMLGYILQCSEVYGRVSVALTGPRSQYLKEHLKTLRLKYK